MRPGDDAANRHADEALLLSRHLLDLLTSRDCVRTSVGAGLVADDRAGLQACARADVPARTR